MAGIKVALGTVTEQPKLEASDVERLVMRLRNLQRYEVGDLYDRWGSPCRYREDSSGDWVRASDVDLMLKELCA